MPMVLQLATLMVRPGDEAAFERAFARAEPLIRHATGYLSHELRRSIENDQHHALLVEWRSLEDHTVRFLSSAGFERLRELVQAFLLVTSGLTVLVTAIIASRFALGVLEAALMTISTTMIGDCYNGRQRERFMSLQTTVSATSAFLLNTLGGAVAEHGWRAPYAVFAVSLLLAPLMLVYLWEPRTRASMTAAQ